jgi:hypothetical protein
MRGWITLACALVALLVVSGAAPGVGRNSEALDMYRATVDAAQAAKLARSGYDVAAVRQSGLRSTSCCPRASVIDSPHKV